MAEDLTPFADRPTITSDSDPIHVDFLPQGVVRLSGRIGMTIAPGKRNFGRRIIWRRDLSKDLTDLRQRYHVNVLVTLLTEQDLEILRIPDLFTAVKAEGLISRWFPIQDFGIPTSMQGLIDLVQFILAEVQQGKTVIIHCKAGLGRTGMVAAACLVALGSTPDAAFALLRKIRPGVVETIEQEQYVAQFEQAWKS